MNTSAKLEVKTAIIKYINRFTLDDVKLQMEEFLRGCNDVYYETFYCPISMNLRNLSEISEFAEQFLLSNPLVMQDIASEVIQLLFKNSYSVALEKNQILTHIVITEQTDLIGGHRSLCSFKGLLSEFTYFKKTFVRTTVWACSNNDCSVQFLNYLPQENSMNCPTCTYQMKELEDFKRFGSRILGQLLLKDMDRQVTRYNVAKWVDFYVEDGRIPNMELGVEYVLTGMWREENGFEVWGSHRFENIVWPVGYHSKVELLRDKLKNDPFAFVKILSTRLGAEKYSIDDFHNFRTFLLLSLASVKSSYPIPVLAICGTTKQEETCLDLMLESMQYAERSIRFRYPFKRFGVEYIWALNLLRGGALTLSRNGICFIGNLEPYPDYIIQIIKNGLEEKNIIPVQGLENNFVDFKCALWSVNLYNKNGKFQDNLQTLYKSFCFIWGNEEVIENNFESNRCNIPKDDLKQYLAAINSLKVKVKQEAVDLIKQYLLASTTLRGNDLPPKMFDLLMSLTEAHARLHKRVDGLVEDVLLVIQLVETTMEPPQNYPSPPKNSCEFYVWLLKFINNFNL